MRERRISWSIFVVGFVGFGVVLGWGCGMLGLVVEEVAGGFGAAGSRFRCSGGSLVVEALDEEEEGAEQLEAAAHGAAAVVWVVVRRGRFGNPCSFRLGVVATGRRKSRLLPLLVVVARLRLASES